MGTLGGKDWAVSTPTITGSISSDPAMTPVPPVALTRSVVELAPRIITALDERVLSAANWWTDENSTQTKTPRVTQYSLLGAGTSLGSVYALTSRR
jgi:hypothetical protein